MTGSINFMRRLHFFIYIENFICNLVDLLVAFLIPPNYPENWEKPHKPILRWQPFGLNYLEWIPRGSCLRAPLKITLRAALQQTHDGLALLGIRISSVMPVLQSPVYSHPREARWLKTPDNRNRDTPVAETDRSSTHYLRTLGNDLFHHIPERHVLWATRALRTGVPLESWRAFQFHPGEYEWNMKTYSTPCIRHRGHSFLFR